MSFSGLYPSSMARVTEDPKKFLRPFQKFAVMNWLDLVTGSSHLMSMTAQPVSHQEKVVFVWACCLLHLASFIYRVILPWESSVHSPKDMKYLQSVALVRACKWAVYSCPIGTQGEMLNFEQKYELSQDYLLMCWSYKFHFFLSFKGFFFSLVICVHACLGSRN